MSFKIKGKTTAAPTQPKRPAPSALKIKAIPAKQTKADILRNIAEETGLTPKQVKAVFTTAGHLARCHLAPQGSGEFIIPEMAIKAVRHTKPATQPRKGRNPTTGETMTIAAKPQRDVIKVRPLKLLKDVLL